MDKPPVRKSDVPITLIYEVDCHICHEAVYPDNRITSRAEAIEIRDQHIAEHDQGEWQ